MESASQQIKNVVYIHTIEYSSSIKQNEITLFAEQREPEVVMLNNISQTQTHKNHKFSLLWGT
jgi:hypothetical protein